MVHSIIIARWPDRFSKTWRRKVANIQKDSLARVELLSRKLSITVLIFGCNARHGAVCYNENDRENVIEEHSGAPSHIRIRMRGNERKMEQVTRTCPRLVLYFVFHILGKSCVTRCHRDPHRIEIGPRIFFQVLPAVTLRFLSEQKFVQNSLMFDHSQ